MIFKNSMCLWECYIWHLHVLQANLKKSILQAVYWFPRTIFKFDEVDKMQPQLIDAIKPFLDYNARIDGVSFNKAILIFLRYSPQIRFSRRSLPLSQKSDQIHNKLCSFFIYSNAGGNVIVEMALDFWREGKDRKVIRMNSKELEFKISENIKNEKSIKFFELCAYMFILHEFVYNNIDHVTCPYHGTKLFKLFHRSLQLITAKEPKNIDTDQANKYGKQ